MEQSNYPLSDSLTRILRRQQGLEGAVNVRQMGGTTEMAAAFQRRQISGAVISMLRVDAAMRMPVAWTKGASILQCGDCGTQEFHRRSPAMIEGIKGGYTESMAALPPEGDGAEGCRRVYPFQGPKIDEIYNDAVIGYALRVEQEAIAPILDSLGRSRFPLKSWLIIHRR